MPERASEAEMAVLAALLEKGRATAAEIHAACEETHGWTHSTVVTFLRRLEAKGLVAHKKPRAQRAFVFQPTHRVATLRRRAVHDMVDRLFAGNLLPLVSSLLEDGKLKEREIRDLHKMIDDHLKEKERTK